MYIFSTTCILIPCEYELHQLQEPLARLSHLNFKKSTNSITRMAYIYNTRQSLEMTEALETRGIQLSKIHYTIRDNKYHPLFQGSRFQLQVQGTKIETQIDISTLLNSKVPKIKMQRQSTAFDVHTDCSQSSCFRLNFSPAPFLG